MSACNRWHGRCNSSGFKEGGIAVNKDVLEGKWGQIKGDIRAWWGDLTDDDVDAIQGDTEKFIGKLQEKYGYGRERAEQELTDFLSLPDNERRRIA
jgi:uncharacterized protein YjbJ (UPF0337 family)